jgi:hypothetical protein
MSQQDVSILQDVELRMQALAEATRLRPMVSSAYRHVQIVRERVIETSVGSLLEQQYLREAKDASERLHHLQIALATIEEDLRRTAYLVELLTERGDMK